MKRKKMALLEATILKAALATSPLALPLVIAGSVGSLLFMDIATARVSNIILKNVER